MKFCGEKCPGKKSNKCDKRNMYVKHREQRQTKYSKPNRNQMNSEFTK